MLTPQSPRKSVIPTSCAALVCLLLLSVPSVAQDIVLSNGSFPTSVYDVNLDLNELTFIKDLESAGQVHAITFCPGEDDLFFLDRNDGTVASLNLDTLVETVLGSLPAGLRIVQMACGLDGLVYFTNTFTEELFTLEPGSCDGVTCTPTLLGTVETAAGLGDVDIEGADLQFSRAGELLLLTNGPIGARDLRLYSIALPCVGFCQATEIGPVATSDINTGMAVLADGRAIISSRDDQIYEIDPEDATVSSLGSLSEAGQAGVFNIRGGDLTARFVPCPPGHGGGGGRSDCWMTGGGSVFDSDSRRVLRLGRTTHGFVLHCDPRKSDNLQINWARSRFHLQDVETAVCLDDPAIEPDPPGATFDTYIGTGVGRYNGARGYCASWTFTDAGEPGTADTATIVITDCGGTGETVLEVSGPLTFGNHQAHSR